MDDKELEQILKIYRSIQGIDNENIVKTNEVFLDGTNIIIIMQYVEGCNLEELTRKMRNSN